MQAKTDHTDLVSRRMGFIPLPLACLVRGVWSSGCGLCQSLALLLLSVCYVCAVMEYTVSNIYFPWEKWSNPIGRPVSMVSIHPFHTHTHTHTDPSAHSTHTQFASWQSSTWYYSTGEILPLPIVPTTTA